MSSVSSIALSGMRAAEARLTAAASNIANARSVQANGQPYRPVDVVQVDIGSGDQAGGVVTSYAPRGLSGANPAPVEAGTAAVPEVDVASELIQASLAKYQFLASVKVFEAGSDMQQDAIDVLA